MFQSEASKEHRFFEAEINMVNLIFYFLLFSVCVMVTLGSFTKLGKIEWFTDLTKTIVVVYCAWALLTLSTYVFSGSR